jgi:hypothetical protein
MKLSKSSMDRFYELFKEKGLKKSLAKDEILNLINFVKNLSEKIVLYRIIFVDKEDMINMEKPGTHYSMDKSELLKNHYTTLGTSEFGKECFLMTVLADKDMVDVERTIANNILHPDEKEVTLKKGGKGIKYLKHERINE